jgi:ubiquinone/menaquinone biosynthesis C-methylase UbiE
MKKIKNTLIKIYSKLPIRIKFLKKSNFDPNAFFDYLIQKFDFNIKPDDKVLDIGSGGYPFPLATHLADLYEGETSHRMEELKRDKRPFTNCDIHELPFQDNEFDFVYCSHLLEHVDDPARACEELMRVAKRGYIETPTKTHDIMLNYLYMENHHKWHVDLTGNSLIFIEYMEHERVSTGTKHFKQQLLSRWANPFQKLVSENQHLFNNMFLWEGKFNYYVFNNKGELIKTNQYEF